MWCSKHVNYSQCTIYISHSMFYLPRIFFGRLFNQHNSVIGWFVVGRWVVCLSVFFFSSTNMINDIALIYFHLSFIISESVERKKNTTKPLKPFNFKLIENLEKLLCHTKPISNQTLLLFHSPHHHLSIYLSVSCHITCPNTFQWLCVFTPKDFKIKQKHTKNPA